MSNGVQIRWDGEPPGNEATGRLSCFSGRPSRFIGTLQMSLLAASPWTITFRLQWKEQ
jgi:hypothetical protein